jgi:WD40-like Beta Propeller Repeat
VRLLAVALAAAGAATFIGGGGATSAATPAPGGRFLVYATPPGVGGGACDAPNCQPDRAWVWRAAIDGTKRKRLTNGLLPSVSPDGRWVAFVRARRDGIQTEIDVIGSRGGPVRRVRRLDEGNESLFELVWAPDSRRLVTLGSRGTVGLSLHGATTVLNADGAGRISFSPDGSQLAYMKTLKTPNGEYRTDVYVTSLNGGDPARVTNDGASHSPAWGKAGIAFLRGDGNVWIAQTDGSGLRQLTGGQLQMVPITWSRDGKRLLAENTPAHNGRLWAIDGATGAARPITDWVGGLDALALSRDGRTILATTGHGGFFGCAGKIETIPYAGGRPRVLIPRMCHASWNG